MPDYKDFFGEIGGRKNGGNARALDVIANQPLPWVWTPDFVWKCKLTALEIVRNPVGVTQTTTITVSATNFVSGLVTMQFTSPDGVAQTPITAEAADGDANTDLAAAIDAALDASGLTAAWTSVSTVSNQVVIVWVEGQGIYDLTLTYTEAHVEEITFAGTMVDGSYTTTISGGGLASPVAVTTLRSTTPATAAAMAIQHEADIEARIATTLADVVQNADDDGAGVNALLFEPDVTSVTVETRGPLQEFDITFGGTETNGDYSTTFTHYSLPNGSHTVTTPRVGGAPATNTNLATQHQADIEADTVIAALVDDGASSSAAAVCTVVTPAGVSGLTMTQSSPAGATLSSTEESLMTSATAAAAGASITVGQFLRIDMSAYGQQIFPTHVIRGVCTIERQVSFGAGRNVYIGDAADTDGILESVSAATTGRAVAATTAAQYLPRYEAAFVPTATIELGTTTTLSAGDMEVQIRFNPSPGPRIAA